MSPRRLGKMLLLAVAYLGSGWLGLRLSAVEPSITLLWPPTGIAVAVLLRGGLGWWPGVALGAILVNLLDGSPLPIAVAISVGNTLAPMAVVWLLGKSGFDPALRDRGQVLRFALLTALGMMISAGLGTLTLRVSGQLSPSNWGSAFVAWWIGDTVGVHVVAPFLLIASWERLDRLRGGLWVGVLGLSGVTIALAGVIFSSEAQLPIAFLSFLPISWAVLRLGPWAGAGVVLMTGAIAAAGTAAGRGPFSGRELQEGLFILAGFLETATFLNLLIRALQEERSRVESKLDSAEELQRAVFEGSQYAIISCDLAGVVRIFSRGAEQLLGFSAAEVVGSRTVLEFHAPEDRERRFGALNLQGARDASGYLQALADRLKRGEREEGDAVFVDKGGTQIPVWLTLVGLSNAGGSLVGVLGIALDQRERIGAERARRENETRMGGIIEAALDGIITIDGSQRIVSFNPAAGTMFNYASEDVLGESIEVLIPERYRGEHSGHVRGFAQEATTQRSMAPRRRVFGRRRDGSEFPVEASIARSRADGAPNYIVTVRDISERVSGEAREQELAAQLRQAQKLEAIGTLAGGIAHDFNNILGAIMGNVELARQDGGPDSPVQDSLAQIDKAARRARDLVRQILAFGRQADGERGPVDLAPILGASVGFLRATLPATVRLETVVEPACPEVLADPTQLQQVIVNLCTNAAQALRDQNGRIVLSLGRVEVGPELSAAHPGLHPGPHVRLAVTDDGEGMDGHTLERMFEPFFTTKPPGLGTGLGLSVAHGIIKAHQGAIWAVSTPSKGTTFELLLPAVGPVLDGAPAPNGALSQGAGERVWVVDDEPALGRVAGRLLGRLGYQVRVESGPEAVLDAIRSNPEGLDVLVTDMNMPGMNGLQLAKEVLKLRPGLPIVLVSGAPGQLSEESWLRAGIAEVVLKPYPLEALASALRRVLKKER